MAFFLENLSKMGIFPRKLFKNGQFSLKWAKVDIFPLKSVKNGYFSLKICQKWLKMAIFDLKMTQKSTKKCPFFVLILTLDYGEIRVKKNPWYIWIAQDLIRSIYTFNIIYTSYLTLFSTLPFDTPLTSYFSKTGSKTAKTDPFWPLNLPYLANEAEFQSNSCFILQISKK